MTANGGKTAPFFVLIMLPFYFEIIFSRLVFANFSEKKGKGFCI